MTAGLYAVGVTSPRENLKIESEVPGRAGGAPPVSRAGAVAPVPYPVDLRLNGKRIKRLDFPTGMPEITRLIIGGPYNPTGRGTTASRARIFVCLPAPAKENPGAPADPFPRSRACVPAPRGRGEHSPLYAFNEKGRATPGADFDSGIQKGSNRSVARVLFRANIPAREPGRPIAHLSRLLATVVFPLSTSLTHCSISGRRGRLQIHGAQEQVRGCWRPSFPIRHFNFPCSAPLGISTTNPDPFSFRSTIVCSRRSEETTVCRQHLREDRSLSIGYPATVRHDRLAEHTTFRVYGSQFPAFCDRSNRRGLLAKQFPAVTSYPNGRPSAARHVILKTCSELRRRPPPTHVPG